jgi:hypothetical protein
MQGLALQWVQENQSTDLVADSVSAISALVPALASRR